MNPMSIISLAMAFIRLNKGQTADGKKIIKEAMDVVQSLGSALKDNKITNVEKKALVKELKEFTAATIKAIDNIVIPE